jgi:hypothetical protein
LRTARRTSVTENHEGRLGLSRLAHGVLIVGKTMKLKVKVGDRGRKAIPAVVHLGQGFEGPDGLQGHRDQRRNAEAHLRRQGAR